MPEELVRLSKRISELGIASRREADAWIEKGWVKVNGEIAVLGMKVRSGDRIQISSKAKAQQDKLVTVVLNKPIGYVSGQAEDGYEPAKVLITAQNRWEKDDSPLRFHPSQLAHLVPAGRLDIDSVGLLVLTQDGRVAKSIIGENSEIEKEYIVRVTRFDGCEPKLTTEQLQLLNYGLSLDGKPLQRAKVTWLNEDELRFILKEGKKRQIRRMCEAVGLKVLRLKRVRVGNIVLGHLPLGQWRYIKEWRGGFFIGCCIFGVYTLQTIGLDSIPSSTSAFLTGLYVAFVPLLQWIVFKNVPQPITIVTIVLAFAGMTLFANPFSVSFSGQIGEWVTVLSALICAAEILSISYFAKGCRPLQLSFTQLITVAALASATLLWHEPIRPTQWCSGLLICITALAAIVSFVQFGIGWALKYVSALRATLIYALEPVFAGIIGWLAGEYFGVTEITGAILIVFAVLVSAWRPNKRKKTEGTTL